MQQSYKVEELKLRKVDVKALVNPVRSLCNSQTHKPELTDEEVKRLCPYLGWCTPEVITKTVENC